MSKRADKIRQDFRSAYMKLNALELVEALRKPGRKPGRKPAGRPVKYSPDDLAAIRSRLPDIAERPDYKSWLESHDRDDAEINQLRYLLHMIKWPKAGDKPSAEALQKALKR